MSSPIPDPEPPTHLHLPGFAIGLLRLPGRGRADLPQGQILPLRATSQPPPGTTDLLVPYPHYGVQEATTVCPPRHDDDRHVSDRRQRHAQLPATRIQRCTTREAL